MKSFIFSTLLFLFPCVVVFGQQAKTDTLAPYTYVHRPAHCIATRIGEGVIIISGAVLLGGEWSGFTGTQASKNTDAAVAIGGIVAGVIILLSGERYEHHHKKRFALTVNGNAAGLVYRF